MKYLEGGMLYLVAEPHIFWSLMIHRKATGRFLPPQPKGREVWTWAETYAAVEAARLAEPMFSSGVPRGTKLTIRSRSLAALQLFNKGNILHGTAPAFVYTLLDAGAIPTVSDVVGRSEECELLMCEGYLPTWWTECETFWEGAVARALAHDKAPCLFFCTPVGCKAADFQSAPCGGYHDPQYQRELQAIKNAATRRR
jgi:hypothetical protein